MQYFNMDMFNESVSQKLAGEIWVGGDRESGLDLFDELPKHEQQAMLEKFQKIVAEYLASLGDARPINQSEVLKLLDAAEVIKYRGDNVYGFIDFSSAVGSWLIEECLELPKQEAEPTKRADPMNDPTWRKQYLQKEKTQELMSMLASARACGGSFSPWEYGRGFTIEEIKAELANRPHIPNKTEAKKIRQIRAERSSGKQRDFRR